MKRRTLLKLLAAGFRIHDFERGWKYHQAQGATKAEWNKYLNNLAENITGAV